MKTEISDIELINSSKQILDQLVEICNGKEAQEKTFDKSRTLIFIKN